jgi:hypothetical protein
MEGLEKLMSFAMAYERRAKTPALYLGRLGETRPPKDSALAAKTSYRQDVISRPCPPGAEARIA